MDIKISTQIKEKHCRTIWFYYYLYVFAPKLFRYILYTIAFAALGFYKFYEFQMFFYILSVAYFVEIIFGFSRYWNKVSKALKISGAFDETTETHLKDSDFEVKCGDNVSNIKYHICNNFFCFKEHIFLLNDNLFIASFADEDLKNEISEFKNCLENCGSKQLYFWSFKRWRLNIIVVIFIIILFTM